MTNTHIDRQTDRQTDRHTQVNLHSGQTVTLTSLTTLLAIMSRPKSSAVKDIDIVIDIADILGQKYRYRIDIGHGDIDPLLV